MNVLVYFPYNRRAIDVLSFIGEMIDRGHQCFLLTTCERGLLHEMAEELGAQAFAYAPPKHNAVVHGVRQVNNLLRFCRQHAIDLVVAHADANILAVCARPFGRFELLTCRHHSDWAYIFHKRKAIVIDRIVNALSTRMIVPSKRVYDQMVEIEGANPAKIHLIPYGYRFSLYHGVNAEHVAEIQARFSCRLRLVEVARLTPGKRLELTFEAIERVVSRQCDVQLIVLGEGPERAAYERWIADHHLTERIHLLGFREDVLDFLSASDVMVHLSVEEASNSAVKEAGWLGTPSIVCRGVGDFDQYVTDGENGFLLDRTDPGRQLEELLQKICQDPSMLPVMGRRMKDVILERFEMGRIIQQYDGFLRAGAHSA